MAITGIVEVSCRSCNDKYTIIVPVAGYKLWTTGQALIQDALPGLTDDERELLKTNICPKCWDKIFKE